MSLIIAPADLAALMGGQPVLLAVEGLPGLSALALPGLTLWALRPEGEDFRLLRPGLETPGEARPLPAVPAAVLGLVAPYAPNVARVQAAFAALAPAGARLEVLEAPDGLAALGAVAARAVGLLGEVAREAARLQRGLVATRRDFEATRQVVMALEQSIGHEIPPPPFLALALEPGAGLTAGGAGGRLQLAQNLNLAADGLCGIALHIAEARTGAEARLRVRLLGVESGTVLGAWLLNGEMLHPGWLALDLPAPVEPRRETAALDIQAELGPGEMLALSLEEAMAAPELAAQQPDGPQHRRALALRAWTAPLGRRFCLPVAWDHEQIGLPLAPEGVPVLLPAQVWQAGRVWPYGLGGMGSLGGGAPRPLLRPEPGTAVLALLPWVPLRGMDVLEAILTVQAGAPEGVEAALWLQPAACAATAPEELDLAAAHAACTGWRRLGRGAEDLRLVLRLPLDAPAMLAVAVVLRRPGGGGAPLAVEWTELQGRRLGALTADPLPAPSQAAPPSPAAATASGAFSAVQLLEHYATEDGGYQHLDLLLEQPRSGGYRWAQLRCKLALNGALPQLEFRLNPDWPVMFEHWPGETADDYGPVFLVREDGVAAAFAERLRTPRDSRALRLLLEQLPVALRQAKLPPGAGDGARWLALAERLLAQAP